MDAKLLIERLKTRGVELRVNGDGIQAEALQEPDSDTKALLDEVPQHREEIKIILSAKTPDKHQTDEVARIHAAWRDLGIKDLDGVRARAGLEPVGEHLANLRSWESKWRSRDGREGHKKSRQ